MLIRFMFSYFILYFPQSDFLVFKTVDCIPIIIYHIIKIFPLFIYSFIKALVLDLFNYLLILNFIPIILLFIFS